MKSDKPETLTAIHHLVVAAREGKEPRVAAKLTSGWVLFGERQFVRGYVLLLPDPVAPSLNALGAQERSQFMVDMARLGDALLKVTNALRINYAILGNVEPALHAHVIPRYADEPEAQRMAHPWTYDWDAAPLFDRSDQATLGDALRRELTRMGAARPMRYDPGVNAAC
jgi:diadenosine tetraphosphate (Ap4A) HIT family hydrolase